eukprot:2589579-Rhodomonas_salina.2
MWVFLPHVWTRQTWDKYTYVVTPSNPRVTDHSAVIVDPRSLLRHSPESRLVLHPDPRWRGSDCKTKMAYSLGPGAVLGLRPLCMRLCMFTSASRCPPIEAVSRMLGFVLRRTSAVSNCLGLYTTPRQWAELV